MHVQSCCFYYKTYCFLTFSSPSASFDLKVPIVQGSLSNNVYERRTSTGNGLFSFFDDGFAQIFSQIATIRVKKLSNTNFISSRHIQREKSSLPVDVRRSKTSLLIPNWWCARGVAHVAVVGLRRRGNVVLEYAVY